jgi:hypothetical protein
MTAEMVFLSTRLHATQTGMGETTILDMLASRLIVLPSVGGNKQPMRCTSSSYHQRKFQAIARHEAGHGTLGLMYGFPFRRVRIFPDLHPVPRGGATLGQVEFTPRWPAYANPMSPRFDIRRARSYYEKDVCMTLAGPLAESRFLGRLPVGLFSGAALEGTDAEHVEALADGLGLSDRQTEKWIARQAFITMDLLYDERIWNAVTAIADELLAQESLTGNDVAQIASDCGVYPGYKPGVNQRKRPLVASAA